MRYFVAGGTGALGRRVVGLLVAAGHQVIATARSESGRAMLHAAGATPVDVDVFDVDQLRHAMAGSIAALRLTTSIPPLMQMRSADAWSETGRLRTQGAQTIIDACIDAGVRTCVHESVSFVYADGGDTWLDEDSPVDDAGSAPLRGALEGERIAARLTERGGRAVILRYAGFYAADSSQNITMAERARRRRLALVGPSRNWYSSIQLDDAASATVAALEAPAGIYNVADDEPVRLAEFMALMAEAAGAPPLRRIPGVLGPAVLGTTWRFLRRSQRVSARRLHDATGWTPSVPTAREGWRQIAEVWSRVTPPKGSLA